VQWVTEALQTVESENLRRITLRPDSSCFTEPEGQQWHDLDRLLVQFWTSHSIRPEILYKAREGREDIRDYVTSLLPELTGRGLVDLVEYAVPLEPVWAMVRG